MRLETTLQRLEATYICGGVAPFAVWLEGLFADRPQQAAQITVLHDDHHECL